MDYKDYYNILGVDRKAGEKEIKKAYRKLARKYHPDVNSGDAATNKKFIEINEANEVLSDPEKRKQYDQLGSQWQQHQRTGGRPEDFNWDTSGSAADRTHTYRTFNPEDFAELFGAKGDHSDFFESIFGRASRQQPNSGRGGQQFYQQSSSQQGRDHEHSVQLTLEEAFHGVKRALEWEDGRKIDAQIPPGVKTGSRVRLKGQGGSGGGAGQSGDLYLVINILPHERFQHDNNDLKTRVKADLFTMLLGGKLSVSSLSRTVQLDIPPETRNGRIFRLKGMGMPNVKHPHQFGDLYVTVEAVLPKNLTAGEKDLIEQWRNLH
ncbi:MAG: curved DNA-binding protein [Desulforhopalus sp.]|jgi:curved DNA-binding protein